MKKKNLTLEIVNSHATGIDVGSRSHYAAIGQGSNVQHITAIRIKSYFCEW